MNDLRLSVRQSLKNPDSTAVAVFTPGIKVLTTEL